MIFFSEYLNASGQSMLFLYLTFWIYNIIVDPKRQYWKWLQQSKTWTSLKNSNPLTRFNWNRPVCIDSTFSRKTTPDWTVEFKHGGSVQSEASSHAGAGGAVEPLSVSLTNTILRLESLATATRHTTW